ncbi:hypothetical protein BDR03DRAFT_964934 [Suillus americanus]|nr:hypothetical protein BDR03DRAFT_964934 [Suillus americanus]
MQHNCGSVIWAAPLASKSSPPCKHSTYYTISPLEPAKHTRQHTSTPNRYSPCCSVSCT